MLNARLRLPLPAAVARTAAALCLAALQPAIAQPEAGPEVQWLLYELPPLYITQGPAQGQGVLDRLLRDALLPQLAGLQHLPNGCVLGMLKNADRESYLYFSRPFPISSAPGLVVRRAELPRWRELLDGQGRISLGAWLNRPDTRFGRAEGRAYGATVDALLAAQPAGRVEKVTSQNPALNLMLMLRRDRIDGLLLLPFELDALAREAGLDTDELQVLPLAEQGPTREGHVACVRTPLGAEVVRRADEVIASAPFRQALAARLRRPASAP